MVSSASQSPVSTSIGPPSTISRPPTAGRRRSRCSWRCGRRRSWAAPPSAARRREQEAPFSTWSPPPPGLRRPRRRRARSCGAPSSSPRAPSTSALLDVVAGADRTAVHRAGHRRVDEPTDGAGLRARRTGATRRTATCRPRVTPIRLDRSRRPAGRTRRRRARPVGRRTRHRRRRRAWPCTRRTSAPRRRPGRGTTLRRLRVVDLDGGAGGGAHRAEQARSVAPRRCATRTERPRTAVSALGPAAACRVGGGVCLSADPVRRGAIRLRVSVEEVGGCATASERLRLQHRHEGREVGGQPCTTDGTAGRAPARPPPPTGRVACDHDLGQQRVVSRRRPSTRSRHRVSHRTRVVAVDRREACRRRGEVARPPGPRRRGGPRWRGRGTHVVLGEARAARPGDA